MDPIDHLPSLRDVIELYDLRAKKSLGQNFLMDPQITDRIAAVAGDLRGQTVIEIGPGPGGLTRSLLRANPDKVVAIEFDPRAVAALQSLKDAAGDRLQILQDDALRLNWVDLLRSLGGAVIVANLPYNISTVLLVGWLRVMADHPDLIKYMVLMFQKEVADRLQAQPHSKDYGRLSILTQWQSRVVHGLTLPPGAFVPPPKIYSSVVRFDPVVHKGKQPQWEVIDRLLMQAFAQRRKMLRGNLKNIIPLLERVGIDPTWRAEDVSIEQYLKLALLIEDAT